MSASAELDTEITEQIVSEMRARAAGHVDYAASLRRWHSGNDELDAWAARCNESARRWGQLANAVDAGLFALLDADAPEAETLRAAVARLNNTTAVTL